MDKKKFREHMKDLNNSFQIMNKIYNNDKYDFTNSIKGFLLDKNIFYDYLKKYNIVKDKIFFNSIFDEEYIKIPFLSPHTIRIFGFLNYKDFQYSFLELNGENVLFYFYSIILTFHDDFFEQVYNYILENNILLGIYIFHTDFEGDFSKINKDFNLYNFPETHFRFVENYTDEINEIFEFLLNVETDINILNQMKKLKELTGF